jgi:hypothetical protein
MFSFDEVVSMCFDILLLHVHSVMMDSCYPEIEAFSGGSN